MEIAIENWKYPFISKRARNWMRKAARYRTETIDSAMDGFIASYIAYAAWVSLFNHDRQWGIDRKRCVEDVREILLSYHQEIKEELDAPAHELAQAIIHGGFNVESSNKTQPELDKKWGTPDGLYALLSTLYNMRCNLFHGQKCMEKEQIAILKPANACMRILNKSLAQIFKEEFDRFIH